MMRKIKLGLIWSLVLIVTVSTNLMSQISGKLMQQPDVSETEITFIYGGDVWVVPKEGGTAIRLSSPKGDESFPKFSPDGKKIAYSANYNGNTEVFVISNKGGIPKQLTYHSYTDRVLDFHPDGTKVLFTSGRESGRQRFSQFYTIGVEGGQADKLAVPFGEFGSFSPDGKLFAYTDKSRLFRTWKRYRGGMASSITLLNLEDYSAQQIIKNGANNELPMWSGNSIYYLSDNDESLRANLWMYDLSSKETKQLTNFKDFDVHFPSIGPKDIVFEAGGDLYLYNLQSGHQTKVSVQIVSDQIDVQTKLVNASKYLASADISPDGKRVVVEARGELFSVPAENGYVKNLSQSSGVAERSPAWSPDGKKIAYWSDKTGEYELYIMDVATNKEEKVTSYGPGFRYSIYWSPDSKKLAFVEQNMKIKVFYLDSKTTTEVDQGLYMLQGNLQGFQVSWSSDSKWMAYSRGKENRNSVVFLFDSEARVKHQVTSGFYDCSQPEFDPENKYLYVVTNRSFNPVYGDFDNSFTYPNATSIGAIPLTSKIGSPLAPKNDEVELKEEAKDEETESAKSKKKDKGDDEIKKDDKPKVEIDLEGFESRMIMLPDEPGNYSTLEAVAGKIIYIKYPNAGSGEESGGAIKYFDLEAREVKTIIGNANGYMIAANEGKMLISQNGSLFVIDIAPDQKADKPLRLNEMTMYVNPREEWRQIFKDAWRIERDFFYDKNMHGLDWQKVYDQYAPLIDEAATRSDVNFLLGEMIGELNASHTYKGGGDGQSSERVNTGYLGVDYALENGAYRIKKVIKTAPWDNEVRSPLSYPGVDVKEGDYLLEVNGMPLDISKEPYYAFKGLGGKTVEITVSSSASKVGSRKVIVETLSDESRLRHLAWIEHNRLMVDKATDGKVGYIYVRSTGVDGQNELMRQFVGQWHKEALIIDERFNSGGQIPDRFIELLNRKPLAYWAVRDGADWQWPPVAHFGPKVMLINGWSGSGGDAFPDYFKKAGLGPLIGTRTWGGLIGISGCPDLIDGGSVTVPTFRMYDPDGKWFREGHGVEPDIEVWEDPSVLIKGGDAQLEKAIEVALKEIKENGYKAPQHPPVEKR